MVFTYAGTVTIKDEDLDKMVEGVKSGCPFYKVFNDVIASYDDEVYYNSDLFRGQVKEIIDQRLSGT